jgi:hypothetical protein
MEVAYTFLPGWNGTVGPPVTSTATHPASCITTQFRGENATEYLAYQSNIVFSLLNRVIYLCSIKVENPVEEVITW